MVIIMIVFIGLLLGLIIFSVKLLRILEVEELSITTLFLSRFLKVIFIALAITYAIGIVFAIINLSSSEFMFVLLLEFAIRVFFFTKIYKLAERLLANLKKDDIFLIENASMIHQIGSYFVYMAIIEISGGLIIGVIKFISMVQKDFTLQTNTAVILFIIIGMIMMIASLIFKKAIAIHEEHQLTI